MMRVLLALLLLVVTVVDAQSETEKKKWIFSLAANHGMWSGDSLDTEGYQSLAFAQLAYDKNHYGASVAGSFANTSYRSSFDDDRLEFGTISDIDVATYYSKKWGALTVRGGIDLKLPTGKNAYSDKELSKLITDDVSTDLMLINSYGAGLNISPHMILVYKFDRVALGFGGKYDITGEYDATGDSPDDNLDPGDNILAIINGVASISKNDYIAFTISYLNIGEDEREGEAIFKQGDTWSGEARYLRTWLEGILTTVMSASIKYQDKNKLVGDESTLSKELSNSNNNVAEFYLSSVYKMSGKLSLNGLVGYKTVGANGYTEDNELYDAGRTKLYVEPGLSWYFKPDMYATFKTRYSQVSDKEDASSSVDVKYGVVNADISLVTSF